MFPPQDETSTSVVVVPRQRSDGSAPAPPDAVVVVLDTALGTSVAAAGVAWRAARVARRAGAPVVRLVGAPLWAGARVAPMMLVRRYAERGADTRKASEVAATRLLQALVPPIADAVLDQLDLTAIVRDRVRLDEIVAQVDVNAVAQGIDLDAVAARLDVDAVAARLDLEAVINRIDIAGLARDVIAEIDLPEIVRESTGTISSEAVQDVRYRSVEADETVARIVDKLFRRGARGDQ